MAACNAALISILAAGRRRGAGASPGMSAVLLRASARPVRGQERECDLRGSIVRVSDSRSDVSLFDGSEEEGAAAARAISPGSPRSHVGADRSGMHGKVGGTYFEWAGALRSDDRRCRGG